MVCPTCKINVPQTKDIDSHYLELMAGGKFFILWVDNAIVLPLKIALNKSGQLHIPSGMHVGVAYLASPLIIAAFSRAGKMSVQWP